MNGRRWSESRLSFDGSKCFPSHSKNAGRNQNFSLPFSLARKMPQKLRFSAGKISATFVGRFSYTFGLSPASPHPHVSTTEEPYLWVSFQEGFCENGGHINWVFLFFISGLFSPDLFRFDGFFPPRFSCFTIIILCFFFFLHFDQEKYRIYIILFGIFWSSKLILREMSVADIIPRMYMGAAADSDCLSSFWRAILVCFKRTVKPRMCQIIDRWIMQVHHRIQLLRSTLAITQKNRRQFHSLHD